MGKINVSASAQNGTENVFEMFLPYILREIKKKEKELHNLRILFEEVKKSKLTPQEIEEIESSFTSEELVSLFQ